MVELGEVCNLIRGITYRKDDEVIENGLKILRANNIDLDNSLNFEDVKQISKNLKLDQNKILKKDDIFICLASGSKSHIGKVAFIENDTDYYFGGFMGVIRLSATNKAIPKYIFQQLRNFRFNDYLKKEISGVNINNLNSKILLKYKIPLPPLSIQNEIVEKIEKQKQIIEGAEKLENARDIDYDIFTNFETENINQFAELNPKKELDIELDDFVSFVPMEAVDGVSGLIKNPQERQLKDVNKGYTYFRNDDVIFAKITPCMENGKTAIAENLKNGVGFGSTEFHVFRARIGKLIPKFIYYFLRTKQFRKIAREKMTGASGHKRVPESFLKEFSWPYPPLETQRQIVEKLDKQMQALEGVRLLKAEAEKRIEEILAGVWGG
ncbi:hypothetical protein B6D29_01200 [Microgenomates bacterium UTCPR1]|nr:MAG: hypothetical protein B6D29_01200 [Microgenomates bacterium UTCPR1]